jgi:hypothetical protein
MIHGIYLKTRPKGTWHLVTTTESPESANHDLSLAIQQAKDEGNEFVEGKIQIFESSFWIPQFLYSVKETKPMYN